MFVRNVIVIASSKLRMRRLARVARIMAVAGVADASQPPLCVFTRSEEREFSLLSYGRRSLRGERRCRPTKRTARVIAVAVLQIYLSDDRPLSPLQSSFLKSRNKIGLLKGVCIRRTSIASRECLPPLYLSLSLSLSLSCLVEAAEDGPDPPRRGPRRLGAVFAVSSSSKTILSASLGTYAARSVTFVRLLTSALSNHALNGIVVTSPQDPAHLNDTIVGPRRTRTNTERSHPKARGETLLSAERVVIRAERADSNAI